MPLGCCELNSINIGFGRWKANPGRVCTGAVVGDTQSIRFSLLFCRNVFVEREEQKHLDERR